MSNHLPRVVRSTIHTCRQHERHIITVFAMVLIACASFVLGMMTQSATATAPMVVEYDGVCAVDGAQSIVSAPVVSAPEGVALEVHSAECMYVGSKNSTKYYPPTCSFAKRIAPENLRCFTSDDDAQSKGYVRSTGC